MCEIKSCSVGYNPNTVQRRHLARQYRIPVEISTKTSTDFYFPTQPRPLIVFVDGRAHLGKTHMIKDEKLQSLLRKKDTEF